MEKPNEIDRNQKHTKEDAVGKYMVIGDYIISLGSICFRAGIAILGVWLMVGYMRNAHEKQIAALVDICQRLDDAAADIQSAKQYYDKAQNRPIYIEVHQNGTGKNDECFDKTNESVSKLHDSLSEE